MEPSTMMAVMAFGGTAVILNTLMAFGLWVNR